MAAFHTHIKQSRLMVAISVLMFLLCIASIVTMFSRYSDSMLEETIQEGQHDLEFFSELIKEAYLKNDFVGIEGLMQSWIRQNLLDYGMEATAPNGFKLFSYHDGRDTHHSHTLQNSIYHNDKLLLTLTLNRDLTTVIHEAEDIQNSFWLVGLGFGMFLGLATWYLLNKYAFRPLEREITQRHFVEAELKRSNVELEKRVMERTAAITKLSSAMEQTDDLVMITNPAGIVEYVNPAFQKITGFSAADVVGAPISDIKSDEHDDAFYERLWNTISTGQPFRDIFINRKSNGDLFYEEKTISPIKDSNGAIINYVSTGKDISQLIETQEKLRHMATHDALTGLPNKTMIGDRLTHAIEQAERNMQQIAVLFLDLNNFKHINDSLGHPVGDALLRSVADTLKDCVRKGDTIGRFGGDEFIIIMEGIKDTKDINFIAQQVLEKISQPFQAAGHEISTSTSIGISVFPHDAIDADTLLKNADAAMYRAKKRGGSQFQFFTQDMTEKAVERLQLQRHLSHAMERNEFKLYYQPKMDIRSGKISGMEALLRWNSQELGPIAPATFIPVLEETGRIVEVGHWVIQKACEFNARLHRMGYTDLRVSVNLSPRQFQDERLIDIIKKAFLACEFNESHLEIEITESLLVDNMERAIKVLHSLHKIGATISIDDFGTGYSSMSYLKRLPIDAQKIDRSFVRDIPDDKEDIAIAKAIIALGENLGLKIIAEGIETEEQLSFFKNTNCTEAQGFLISRPLPEEAFIEFLKTYEASKSEELHTGSQLVR